MGRSTPAPRIHAEEPHDVAPPRISSLAIWGESAALMSRPTQATQAMSRRAVGLLTLAGKGGSRKLKNDQGIDRRRTIAAGVEATMADTEPHSHC